MENVLTTKTINQINVPENRFFIPDYQRGYRWKEPEIHALLDDVLAHIDRRPVPDRKYCLQPIVVAEREDGSWEVIDGQQRITSIYIILRFLSPAETAFSIHLATREDSQSFLADISSANPGRDNDIDLFHISAAWQTVDDWFTEHSKGRGSLKQKFFIGLSEEVDVIWYEIRDGSNHMDVFTRLNDGKIPLTNAELTKALLITSLGQNASRDILSIQWDTIESELRDDRFWLYVNTDNTQDASRIDLLFKFHFQFYRPEKAPPRDLDVFHEFEEFVGTGDDRAARAGELWSQMRELFQRLSEWFENREIYHLTGYLISSGVALVNLYRLSDGVKKSEFIRSLKDMIVRSIGKDLRDRSIFDLNYHDDAPLINKILLLFNIVAEQQSVDLDQRFSFSQYKKHHWSLEHIHAQAAESLSKDSERRRWLEDHKTILEVLSGNGEAKEIIQCIDDLMAAERVDDRFLDVEKRVFALMSADDDTDEINGIENLTLLDRETNSHLQNAVFAVKRNRMVDRDRLGHFILATTRNVFLKYYSPSVDHVHYWSQEDRKQYGTAIEKSLKEYFGAAIFGGNR